MKSNQGNCPIYWHYLSLFLPPTQSADWGHSSNHILPRPLWANHFAAVKPLKCFLLCCCQCLIDVTPPVTSGFHHNQCPVSFHWAPHLIHIDAQPTLFILSPPPTDSIWGIFLFTSWPHFPLERLTPPKTPLIFLQLYYCVLRQIHLLNYSFLSLSWLKYFCVRSWSIAESTGNVHWQPPWMSSWVKGNFWQ